MKECLIALGVYIGAAILFGLGVWYFAGSEYGGEFFAGWLTEYSLSIDNLFIFIIIMGKFAVPRQYQQNALMIGIILALVLARHLHRGRRRSHQRVQLGLLHLRRLPGLHGGQPGPQGDERRATSYDEPRIVRWFAQAAAGQRGVERRQALRPRERQAAADPDG